MNDMPKIMSEEWLDLYKAAINSNEAYAKAASWWTGDFVFVVRASGNLDHDIFAYIGLHKGECTGVKSLTGESEYEVVPPDGTASSDDKIAVEYTYEANYDSWVEILNGKLDPIRGLLSGKAKIQGEMAKVLKATDAAKELVRSSSMVDTEFY
ncbi:MAG: SCP2 sterol-binding domain-containing protein [Candidatus Thorarchaeota archaeon]|nr:SCP2 sterol-binding domain-containing protein [Candidatus Thorarchaeota archaeon]